MTHLFTALATVFVFAFSASSLAQEDREPREDADVYTGPPIIERSLSGVHRSQ